MHHFNQQGITVSNIQSASLLVSRDRAFGPATGGKIVGSCDLDGSNMDSFKSVRHSAVRILLSTLSFLEFSKQVGGEM
jgi:hypothetical protein